MDQRAQARPLRGGVLRSDERGIMIVEVMVSAVLLVVLAIATLSILDRAGAVSGDNRARSIATTLAQQDQDDARQWAFRRVIAKFTTAGPSADIPVGTTKWMHDGPDGVSNGVDDFRTVTIDDISYRVKTSFKVVADNGNKQTACLAGWKSKKIEVETTATPPAGIKIKPVKMRTFRVPTIVDGTNKGGVIVRLLQADGDATQNVPVRVTDTAGARNDTTKSDGCVVFNDVNAGQVTVTWGTAGVSTFVDENGGEQVSRTFTLQAGSTAQFAGLFDAPKAPTIKFVDENGAENTPDGVPIQWNSVAVVHSGISTVYNGWRHWLNATPSHSITLSKIFPFESEYAVFAGNCWGNDPTMWESQSVSGNTMLMNDDNTTGADVAEMPKARFRFTTQGAGYRVFVAYEYRVTKMGNGKCSAKVGTLNHGILPAAAPAARRAAPVKQTGTAAVTSLQDIWYALPYGIYKICVDNVITGQRYNRPLRLNNTPDGTLGTGLPSDPRRYGPTRTLDGVRGLEIPSAPSADWVSGSCPADPDNSSWPELPRPLNPTD